MNWLKINRTVVNQNNLKNMEPGKYQFLAIVAVFTFGFFSHDLFSGTEHDDNIYYQDTAPLLQCTINLDCDNHYDREYIFSQKRRFHSIYIY